MNPISLSGSLRLLPLALTLGCASLFAKDEDDGSTDDTESTDENNVADETGGDDDGGGGAEDGGGSNGGGSNGGGSGGSGSGGSGSGGSGSGGSGSGGSGSGSGGGDGDPDEDPCGRSTANQFYVARLQLLIDPVDFADESWDWDGEGIDDFWSEYGWMIDLLATYTGYGEAYDVVDLLIPFADEAAPILASPYVSPDPMAIWWEMDSAGNVEAVDEVWHDEDQNLLQYEDLALTFTNDEDLLVLEVYDRDLAFDDYAGWDYVDRPTLRALADCGPYVYVYTDAQMAELDSRVRAFGIEVESW